MEGKKTRVLVTTPAYYTNNLPSIGHFYTNLVASWIASSLGVPLLSGNDVHGRKMRTHCNRVGGPALATIVDSGLAFKESFRHLAPGGDFAWTHSGHHHDFVLSVMRELDSKGYVSRGEYAGWYSVEDETFVSDEAVGDHREGYVWSKEKNLFLDLAVVKSDVLARYASGSVTFYPEAFRKQAMESVEQLGRICISRREPWGIATPLMPGRTVHVWVDALLYYLSSSNISLGALREEKLFLVQVLGKDILTFHAVHFVALLVMLGLDFEVHFVVTGWLLVSQEKISKRLGNYRPLEPRQMFCYVPLLLGRDVGKDISIDWLPSLEQSQATMVNGYLNTVARIARIVSTRQHSFRDSRLPVVPGHELLRGLNRLIPWLRPWEKSGGRTLTLMKLSSTVA